jgi:hypothetical protein
MYIKISNGCGTAPGNLVDIPKQAHLSKIGECVSNEEMGQEICLGPLSLKFVLTSYTCLLYSEEPALKHSLNVAMDIDPSSWGRDIPQDVPNIDSLVWLDHFSQFLDDTNSNQFINCCIEIIFGYSTTS